MEQKVLVCGGRDYSDAKSLNMVLDAAHSANPIVMLIHGAARGADTLAEKWAEANGVTSNAYPADWKRDGKAAGPMRNQRMLDQCKPHMVIAFPGAAEHLANMKTWVPQLREISMLPGCGHWTQQERPAEVNAAIVEFLRSLPK